MMRTVVITLVVALNAAAAHAHPSVVPHEHPHAASVLPDALALLMAALVVGLGLAALRRIRKNQRHG
jgi:hypothetical protein